MNAALREIAEEVYSEWGATAAAVTELVRRFQDDADLHDLAIQFAASEALHYAQLLIRRRVEEAEPAEPVHTYPPEVQAGIDSHVKPLVKGWYDWPLMTGLRLGEATWEDLHDNQSRYQKMADGNVRKARFLGLVATRVRPGQKVREAYTEKELAALMKRAGKRRRGEAA